MGACDAIQRKVPRKNAPFEHLDGVVLEVQNKPQDEAYERQDPENEGEGGVGNVREQLLGPRAGG